MWVDTPLTAERAGPSSKTPQPDFCRVTCDFANSGRAATSEKLDLIVNGLRGRPVEVERSCVRFQQAWNLVMPCQAALDPLPPDAAHADPPGGVVKQLAYFVRKIGGVIRARI